MDTAPGPSGESQFTPEMIRIASETSFPAEAVREVLAIFKNPQLAEALIVRCAELGMNSTQMVAAASDAMDQVKMVLGPTFFADESPGKPWLAVYYRTRSDGTEATETVSFAQHDQAVAFLTLLDQSAYAVAVFHRPTQKLEMIDRLKRVDESKLLALLNTPPPPAPQFRSAIPVYRAPDRAAWKEKHRGGGDKGSGRSAGEREPREPYELDSETIPNKFFTRARAALSRDESTLGFDKAIAAQTALDDVHMGVAVQQAEMGAMGADDLVFFDPQTDSFWVYPQ